MSGQHAQWPNCWSLHSHISCESKSQTGCLSWLSLCNSDKILPREKVLIGIINSSVKQTNKNSHRSQIPIQRKQPCGVWSSQTTMHMHLSCPQRRIVAPQASWEWSTCCKQPDSTVIIGMGVDSIRVGGSKKYVPKVLILSLKST